MCLFDVKSYNVAFYTWNQILNLVLFFSEFWKTSLSKTEFDLENFPLLFHPIKYKKILMGFIKVDWCWSTLGPGSNDRQTGSFQGGPYRSSTTNSTKYWKAEGLSTINCPSVSEFSWGCIPVKWIQKYPISVDENKTWQKNKWKSEHN